MQGEPVEQVQQCQIEIARGHKFFAEDAAGAIARINQAVDWQEDNDEIFSILASRPKFCYFAQVANQIVGYAIIREDGEDRHLHVSWIATDMNNCGIGTLLMHKIIQKNKKLGHKILTLHHRKANTKAKRFYEKIAELEAVQYICEEINPEEYRITYRMYTERNS